MLDLFGDATPAPEALLAADPEALRDVGLSWRKVEYVRDLAAHVLSGELELDRLDELSDDEVIAEITAVRGFGVWSAQMFLIFFLERPDVLPTGDLGIRKAVQVAYGLDETPAPADLERIAEPWRPRRSLACIYLVGASPANEPAEAADREVPRGVRVAGGVRFAPERESHTPGRVRARVLFSSKAPVSDGYRSTRPVAGLQISALWKFA